MNSYNEYNAKNRFSSSSWEFLFLLDKKDKQGLFSPQIQSKILKKKRLSYKKVQG